MNTFNPENLSPFGRLAVKLDHEFSELERISGQITRLDIETESGLDRAVKLMTEFAQYGQSIGEAMQNFSQSLQSAREKAELAAKTVAERAKRVQVRKQEQDQLLEKFSQLSAKVKQVSETIAQMKKPQDDIEKTQVPAKLLEIDVHLTQFIAEAQALKEEAHSSKLKGVERNAESLWSTLQSARRKLGTVLPATHGIMRETH